MLDDVVLCEVLPSPRMWAFRTIQSESDYVNRQAESCLYLNEVAYPEVLAAVPDSPPEVASKLPAVVERLRQVHLRQYVCLLPYTSDLSIRTHSYYFSELHLGLRLRQPLPLDLSRLQFLVVLMLYIAVYQRGRDRYERLSQIGPKYPTAWLRFQADASSNATHLSHLVRACYLPDEIARAEEAVCRVEAQVIRRIWQHNKIRVCY